MSLIPISKKGISYKAAISCKAIKSIKEEQVLVKNENQNNSNDLNELNGIIVFSKKGCSRSKKTIDYLNDKKIKHTELDITSNKENYELMWEKLNLKTPTNITFPVIIVNNKPSHSHKDLDLFLKKYKVISSF